MAKRTKQHKKKSPTSASTPDLPAKDKAILAIKTLSMLLVRTIVFADENLRYVGENAGSMFSFLKLCGVNLGIDFSKILDIGREPIGPADFMKIVGYGGMVVLLCYIGMSKRPSSCARRLSGLAVFSTVGHFLWILLSGVPTSYRLCFVCVCLFCFAAEKMST